jgi:predicted PurR-regulated permease PerM
MGQIFQVSWQIQNRSFSEFIIVAILNTCGLLILGIDYALLLGLLGALLNIIPYLGGMLAMLMFTLVALVTKEPIYMIYVVMLYATIQLIDNNYIVPRIVGSKVKLNALTSLLTVILGAALWGIPGMFLSIPITAIVKLLLDHSPGLQPWGFLLGDTSAAQPVIEVKSSVSEQAHATPVLSPSLRLKRRRPFKEFWPPK